VGVKSNAQKVVWAAYDDPVNAALKQQFRRDYRFYRQQPTGDATHPLVRFPVQPSIAHMPALLIAPQKGSGRWNANQHQKLIVDLLAIIWVPHADIELAEDLHDDLRRAFFRTINPATGMEYWRGDPATVAWWNIAQEDWTFGIEPVDPQAETPQWCTRLTFSIQLTTNHNPTL
jgi:hypothetical protein